MKKCMYAFDVEDDYCKNCDGVTMEENGKKVPCSNCSGYAEGEEVEEEEAKEEEVKEVVADVPKEEAKEEVKEPIKTTKEEKKKEDTNKNTPKEEKPLKTSNTKPEHVCNCKPSSKVEVKAIRYMSGASVDRNGVWYKFECCEERILPGSLTEEQIQEEREKLWAQVNGDIDKQIEDVTK